MNRFIIRSLAAVGVSTLASFSVSTTVLAQDEALCPCSFASAIRTRVLTGAEMRCQGVDLDIANVPPHGVTSKQNRFIVEIRNRKGVVSKSINYDLNEQGLLAAADFGGTVRYAPTCAVRESGKRRVRIREAAYILSAAEYRGCARDLSALVASVKATASNAPISSCDDADQSGVIDAWEPLVPTSQYCFDDFGNAIQCPSLP